ncbi:hypothetical protein FHS04_002076 [Mesoflavibacter sabulilitoris]|uniref:Lipoprotein n=1 Tax=Mesoflavibacter zeaxanthinifaciens subsp. sabulilitoris TaxID=1520893 RepID=A0A2T1NM08_9FLAO|nr:hypothetical protein [Mesoflavibacter zeaxanthinifaciens]MBB3124553.1 hypothetical protein [Mesoflavibacter zeaxanthinifaciens subsp. sabulilitoris]PSG93920.1 hypothetical protein C7H61_01735 [Mesoflavibacter zeaxanthinifaciens subsp. sabulilitoris]
MKNLKLFLFAIGAYLFLSSCCTTKVVYCTDNRPVTYPKNQKCALKAYKESVAGFEVNLESTIQDIIEIGSLTVGSEPKLLREKLNNESARHQDALKASFIALSTDPCMNSERHYKLVESINKRNYDLQELRAKLENNGLETVKNYLYERGKIEGKAMKEIIDSLKNYYGINTKYPETLDELNVNNAILTLGESRLDYKMTNEKTFVLKFAGEDYALGTEDDKIYKGTNDLIQ